MKIAIIGVRGIPVVYGGFESFAEQLSLELVKNSYDITVYCRTAYVKSTKKDFKGIHLQSLPAIKRKNFETFTHSFISTLHACFFGKYDLIYYLGVGNAPFTFIPRLFGIKTIINVDGLDWKREKWSWLAKKYLKLSEYLATLFANVVITDSIFIRDYYKKNYKKDTVYIPYSAIQYLNDERERKKLLKKYCLTRRKYFIWVGRLVPDNHLEDLILAFKKLKSDYKCLIAGDDLFKSDYRQSIRELAKSDKRIVFTGFIDKKDVYFLEKDCLAYVETKRSGGTHQSLVEALRAGCFIVVDDYPANKQILKSAAVYYSHNEGSTDLLKKFKNIIKQKFDINNFIVKSNELFKNKYELQIVINKYIELFTHRE